MGSHLRIQFKHPSKLHFIFNITFNIKEIKVSKVLRDMDPNCAQG